jgi:AAA+ superfamily predicted ATPase
MTTPKLFVILALIGFFIPSCAVNTTPRPSQRILIEPLEHGYVVGHTAGNSMLLLNEFVREGDSIKDWETLVTRFYGRSGPSAFEVATATRNELKRDCPHAKVSMKKLSDTEYIVEHSHNGCGQYEGHRSVRKIVQGRDGVYIIAFDMKNRAYSSTEFRTWRSRIISSRLSE